MPAVRPLCKSAPAWLAFLIVAALWLPVPDALAQGRKIIRDAEIENTIRTYSTPIFQAAGLNPNKIEVFLIDDPSLNAFVTQGQRMFIHTGLLMKADDPSQVIGVIAHETGHAAGGHVASRIGEIQEASQGVWITYLLGIGAAIATGQGALAPAIIAGGQDIILRNVLTYTRGQEQAADQAAVQLLKATEQSPEGLLEFMRLLGGQEALYASNQDPYLRTHPLAIERVTFLERAVAESPYTGKPTPPELQERHDRLRAKLIGFLQPPRQVFRAYPEGDTSLPARYARAIAHYRRSDLKSALPLIDGLIEEHPEDPFFQELKGQVLFEHGRIDESLPYLERASELLPNSAQIRLLLARNQLELNDPQYDSRALDNLRQVVDQEPGNSFAWKLSAVGYGRLGDKGMTALSMAESALTSGRFQEAIGHADRAMKILPASPAARARSGVAGVARPPASGRGRSPCPAGGPLAPGGQAHTSAVPSGSCTMRRSRTATCACGVGGFVGAGTPFSCSVPANALILRSSTSRIVDACTCCSAILISSGSVHAFAAARAVRTVRVIASIVYRSICCSCRPTPDALAVTAVTKSAGSVGSSSSLNSCRTAAGATGSAATTRPSRRSMVATSPGRAVVESSARRRSSSSRPSWVVRVGRFDLGECIELAGELAAHRRLRGQRSCIDPALRRLALLSRPPLDDGDPPQAGTLPAPGVLRLGLGWQIGVLGLCVQETPMHAHAGVHAKPSHGGVQRLGSEPIRLRPGGLARPILQVYSIPNLS